MMESKKALLFLTNGFEETEALATADILIRGGAEVISVSLDGGNMVTGSHGIRVMADIGFDETAEDFDCLILPGGPGTDNYRKNSVFIEFVRKHHKKGMLLTAICAAPTFLAEIGVLSGKRAVCFPGMEHLMAEAVLGQNIVEEDGNIITSKSAATAPYFAFAILERLMGKAARDKVYRQMHFELLER